MSAMLEKLLSGLGVGSTGTKKEPFVPRPGTGALFAVMDGDVVVVTGNFITPEGLIVDFVGEVPEEDASAIVCGGSVQSLPDMVVSLVLGGDISGDEDQTFKKGVLTLSGPALTKAYHINTKLKYGKTNDKPYRFMWFTRGDTVAF